MLVQTDSGVVLAFSLLQCVSSLPGPCPANTWCGDVSVGDRVNDGTSPTVLGRVGKLSYAPTMVHVQALAAGTTVMPARVVAGHIPASLQDPTAYLLAAQAYATGATLAPTPAPTPTVGDGVCVPIADCVVHGGEGVDAGACPEGATCCVGSSLGNNSYNISTQLSVVPAVHASTKTLVLAVQSNDDEALIAALDASPTAGEQQPFM